MKLKTFESKYTNIRIVKSKVCVCTYICIQTIHCVTFECINIYIIKCVLMILYIMSYSII